MTIYAYCEVYTRKCASENDNVLKYDTVCHSFRHSNGNTESRSLDPRGHNDGLLCEFWFVRSNKFWSFSTQCVIRRMTINKHFPAESYRISSICRRLNAISLQGLPLSPVLSACRPFWCSPFHHRELSPFPWQNVKKKLDIDWNGVFNDGVGKLFHEFSVKNNEAYAMYHTQWANDLRQPLQSRQS